MVIGARTAADVRSSFLEASYDRTLLFCRYTTIKIHMESQKGRSEQQNVMHTLLRRYTYETATGVGTDDVPGSVTKR